MKRFPEKVMQSQSKTNSEVEQDRAMLRKVFLLVSAIVMVGSVMAACSRPAQSPPTPTASQPPATTVKQPPEQTAPVDNAIDETDWNLVQTFNGKSSRTAPPFHIYGTKWRIRWAIDTEDLKYAVFQLLVYATDKPGILTKRISHSGSTSSDTVYIYEDGGNYHLKIIAANVRNWTVTVEDYAATEVLISPVQIVYINYKGRDFNKTLEMGYDIVEADEYVEIKNLSDSQQNITNWVLKNISKGGPAFTFPTFRPCPCSQYNNWESCVKHCYPPRPCVIEPHKSIRVYTGEVHPESGGFCFYYTLGDVWDNEKPDIAVLYNSGGEVSRKSYIIPGKE